MAFLRLPRAACLGLGLALSLACGDPAPDATEPVAPDAAASGYSPNASVDAFEDLVAASELEYHPSDGGGRAWVEHSEPMPLRAGSPGRVVLVYEAGPEGVANEGLITLQVSPFWGWSTPQLDYPDAPGFTRVTTEAQAVTLETATLGDQLLGIFLREGRLAAGERIRIDYGAGDAGAAVDQFADADSKFWFAVDGNGDGYRKLIAESPALPVVAGEAAQLHATLPSVARPGETLRLHLAVLDAEGSRGTRVEGEATLTDEAGLLELPRVVRFTREDGGVRVVAARARAAGLTRVHVRLGEFEATSNPLQIDSVGPRILWGDLHGHTGLSDGTGVPDDYFAYARDVAGLDVVALTDHDHWGMRPLVKTPAYWDTIRASVRSHHEPGRLVALLGFEWTSWLYGHRHVVYFSDDGPLVDSVAPETRTPPQLWAALEGQTALTFAHHTAGEPIATAWDFAPDPRFEPVVEVVSVHGSSEAADSPDTVLGALPGHFVRDALDRDYRLGFIGSGDGHDGHPGFGHLASPSGGLAAILAEERTREAVLAALRARRSYATNGARIILRMGLGDAKMGETLRLPPDGGPVPLFVQIVGSAPFEYIDLVRRGEAVLRRPLEERGDAALHADVEGLSPGDWLYVRARQIDGGMAWSSPIFVE